MRARHSSMRSSRTGLQGGSSGGKRWVWMSMLLMPAAALPAGGVRRIAPVARENGRQLLDDVGEMERLAVQLGPASVADPEEGVLLVRQAAALDHQPHRLRRTLRRMRRVGREQEDLALADGDIDGLPLAQQ